MNSEEKTLESPRLGSKFVKRNIPVQLLELASSRFNAKEAARIQHQNWNASLTVRQPSASSTLRLSLSGIRKYRPGLIYLRLPIISETRLLLSIKPLFTLNPVDKSAMRETYPAQDLLSGFEIQKRMNAEFIFISANLLKVKLKR